ncbi:alpha-L-fucosidase [Halyomorpha halys]|uniref:alpha-L-fucosidase n=1 Tax=Halyomorpha halys TaxID=286706 RepID=UPI0006D4C727|nr:alpha-L-fucosidase-like [Halyomorpha halys]
MTRNSNVHRLICLICIIATFLSSWAIDIKSPLLKEGKVRPPPLPPSQLKHYDPNWSSLDARILPSWFDKVKVGIFIHWGVYAVPSICSEWFWIDWKGNPSPNVKAQQEITEFMEKNYKPGFTYQDFANDFTAEFFNATEWADLIEKSGAKYVVLTSKHHDGYSLWPSTFAYSWNSVDVGPHKDIIDEVSKAVRSRKGLRFGLYHSLYEWFHPLYLADKQTNFTAQNFVDNKILPEMKELINKYKPEILWSDGEWEAPSKYWKSEEFLAWLYNESPVKESVVVNDRWGQETLCKHGGYLTCSDRYIPGKLLPRKWENAMTLDKGSWGYNRKSNLDDYLSTQQMIDLLSRTIALGGNILINVGPSKDGKINPIFQERLLDLGKWLNVNGEAIYESSPWDVCQNDSSQPDIWYTTKNAGKDLYVIMLRWPKSNNVYLSCPQISDKSKISLLGLPGIKLQGVMTEKHLLKIALPDKALVENEWGWTIKIKNVVSP